MVTIVELDPGQSHTLAPTALRVALTGAEGHGIELRAVDQAGAESVAHRLTGAEVVVTPQPRRLRLLAVPVGSASFAPGVRLGLSVRTEGAAATTEQALISPADVGALPSFEIGVLEFAVNRAVLTASGKQDAPIPVDDDPAWLAPGRYAVRNAAKLAPLAPSPDRWGLVVDGSASWGRLKRNGELRRLHELLIGMYVEWTHRWPVASSIAGLAEVPVDTLVRDPEQLLATAFGREPGSWAGIAEAVDRVAARLGGPGEVVVLADGPPGDLPRLRAILERHPDLELAVVCLGTSVHGLPRDGAVPPWEEELAGFSLLTGTSSRVAAIRVDADDTLRLGDAHAGELAGRLVTSALRSVPA